LHLLLIEDDSQIAALIKEGFTNQGYEIDRAATGQEGETLALERAYDVILLDVMLPDGDGIQVCRNLRSRGLETPILMLTALASTLDKVAGLEAGADDYLTKPFEFEELLARVRALLRRGEAQAGAVLRFDDIEMDLVRRQVVRAGQRIRLTTKEFALLEYLIRNPGRVLSRAEISAQVWDMEFDSESNVIDVYISMLRRKIDRDFPRPVIHTIVGAGYVLSRANPNP
jgi:two-component system, OmpR family, copper resistance phosphate regulon response regulator CusR